MCDIDMLCDCCKEDTFELSKRVGCSFHIALGWLAKQSGRYIGIQKGGCKGMSLRPCLVTSTLSARVLNVYEAKTVLLLVQN